MVTGLLVRPVTVQPPDSKKSRESLLSSVSSLSPYSTQMVTEDSTVYYNRSIMGTFTVKLKVVAEWEQAALPAGKGIVQKTGHFSGSLKLQGGSRGWRWGGGFSASRSPASLASGQGHKPQWAVPQSSTWGGNTQPAVPGFGKRGAHTAWAWEPRDICPYPPGLTGPSVFQKPFEASRSWGPLKFRPSRTCQ